MGTRRPIQLCLVAAALIASATHAFADVQEDLAAITAAIRAGEIDKAFTLHQASLKEHPDDLRLRSQSTLLWGYLGRANRQEDARDLLADYLQWSMEKKRFAGLSTIVSRLGFSHQQLNSTAAYHESLAKYEKQLAQLDDMQAVSAWSSIARELALASRNSGKAEQAKAKFAPVLAKARELFAKADEDAGALSTMATVLATAAEVESDEAVAAQLRGESVSILHSAIKAEVPRWTSLLLPYTTQVSGYVRGLTAAGEFETANAALEQMTELVESLDEDNRYRQSMQRSLSSIKSRFDADKKHYELVGKPAFPLDVVSWVNGEELTDEALKGKVVLLDFWAVWCGPCIATFPHLREWHEKYSDKGLVIIGMTRHYGYGWNDETNRPAREQGISPEDEEAAMVDFAAYHKLSHRFGVMPQGSEFSANYGVRGIPQAVVIDREGKIRMIKVGSGEANAKAIDELLAELLGDST